LDNRRRNASAGGGKAVRQMIDSVKQIPMNNMQKFFQSHKYSILAALVVALGTTGAVVIAQDAKPAADKKEGAATAAPRAAMTVTVVTPQSASWPINVPASGNVAAWQEALVGSEIGGLRIAEVLVNVGDVVKKGQTLARISSTTVAADVAAQKAAVTEAQAAASEAQANAERGRSLQASGAISAQQILQFDTAAKSAAARLESAKARLQVEQTRLAQTRVLAPDAGVITARMATVGQVTQPGQEMFKLIRQNRLEWRADVTATEALNIKPGQTALITSANGEKISGKVRVVAPTADPNTRNTQVYVDLPASVQGLKAGMFARGAFELGASNALTVPQQALVLRDGFSYLFLVQSDSKVVQTKVTPGRRVGDKVEITQGLQPSQRVAVSGAAFLTDGDVVRIAAAPTTSATAAAAASGTAAKAKQ
jgi:HlyD family secretion protein